MPQEKLPRRVVRESSSDMERWSEIEPVLQEFADFLGVDVNAFNPHGKTSEPQTEAGKLYVRFWAVPRGAGERQQISEAFGIRLVDGQRDACLPTGDGIPVVDPTTGVIVGEVVDGTLYVLFDLPHGANAGALMRAIMEQFVLLQKSPEEHARWQAEAAERQKKASREAYVRECSKRFERTVEGTRKAIVDSHAAVKKLQGELVRKIRETRGAERKLEQLEASRGGQVEEYAREYDKLLEVPKVQRVEAKEGKVVVYTDILYCVDPRSGKCHEIGAFRIELDTTRGCPRWFNSTRQVDGYKPGQMAPHIWSNGEACLGNTAEIFPELIGNFEFSAAAQVAIQFVESVNTDDAAGKKITQWPVASEAPAKEAAHV